MDDLVSDIKNRYDGVKARVNIACEKAGRNPNDLQIVVVSKTKPPAVIDAAIQAGVRIFGENYPEETADKIPQIYNADSVEWHMIGHCQSRKIGYVVDHFHFMHSLDSVELAIKLNDQLVAANKVLPVLLEINVAGEETKNGWNISCYKDVSAHTTDFDIISGLSNLRWSGLMTMPPLGIDQEETRLYFKKLNEIRYVLQEKYSDQNLLHLSMGTSTDFETAIEEGATFIRIGQAILGPREYRNK